MKLMQKVEKGVTLIELLIALSIVSAVMVGIGSQMEVGGDVWQSADTHTELLQNGLIGMDKMTRELKQAKSIYEVEFIVDDTGKPIINVDGSVSYYSISFKDVNNFSSNFRYNDNYVKYNDGSADAQLAGPITSLKFTCYDPDGVTPITYVYDSKTKKYVTPTTELDKIRLVKIEMIAKETGSAIEVPVTSKVSVGGEEWSVNDGSGGGGGGNNDDEKGINGIHNYAIFAAEGVDIKNNSNIWSPQSKLKGSFDEDIVKKFPASVGSSTTGALKNNAEVYGSVIAKGYDIGNSGNIYGDLISDVKGEIKNSPVHGDVIYGTDFNFYNTLPGPTQIPTGSSYQAWNNQTLTPGTYYLKNITGNVNINFTDDNVSKNNGVQIFVEGNANLNITLRLNGIVLDIDNAEDMKKVAMIAPMIYVESQGNITVGNNSSLIGTFYTSNLLKEEDVDKKGNITTTIIKGNITSGNNLTVIGALYGRGIVDISNNLEVIYVHADSSVLPDSWK